MVGSTLRRDQRAGPGGASRPPPASSGCAFGMRSDECRPEATGRLGARPQAEPGRAHQAGEGAARHPRRAARADRGRLRERRRGGHRPPAVVGPLPRQAQDRDVHAPRSRSRRACCRRRAARDRRGLEPLRQGRRRALDAAVHPAALARAREAAGRLRPPRRGRASRPPAAAATPCATSPAARSQGIAADELFDATPIVDRGGRPLLRQPRLREPAAQAQVHDLGLRRPLQRARDQLRLADRRRQRRPRGLRGPRRRRALLGAPDRPGHRRLRPQGGGDRDPRRVTKRLVGGPQLPRLARQGAAQVHGRRHRRRRHPRAGRGQARPQARGLRAPADHRSSRRTTSASTRRGRRASPTSACRCTSA